MARQPKHVDVTTHLLVEPDWHHYATVEGQPLLKGGKVTKATQNRPTRPREGVAVKITLRLPSSVFLPLMPEAIIEVQPDQVETIIVTASNPEDEADAGREDDE